MKIEYSKLGDYYFPNLYLDTNFKYSEIGRYGKLRLKFLKEHRKAEYIILFMNNKLQDKIYQSYTYSILNVWDWKIILNYK